MTSKTVQIKIRPPTTSNLPPVESIAPTMDQLSGLWHVTDSTLPLWSDKRNVTISYTPIEPKTGSNQQSLKRMNDCVAYQSLTSDKVKTIDGIDTASDEGTANWEWRGTGWLKLITSHWEILSFGQDSGVDWALIYFYSTYITPFGLDILCKSKEGVSAETVSAIKEALTKTEDPVLKKMAGEMYSVKHD